MGVAGHADVLAHIDHWLSQVVIGLNLCPFASVPHKAGRVRKVVCDSADEACVAQALVEELHLLQASSTSELETTLLVTPHCFTNFLDYNEFLGLVDDLIEQLGWQGVFQVASFHPDYQFAGTHKEDDGNLTNCAPYPLFHLLREESLSRAVNGYPAVAQVPEINIKTMHSLTPEQKKQLFYYLARF
jgi:hypothetical protein